jgi:hypothetical protein
VELSLFFELETAEVLSDMKGDNKTAPFLSHGESRVLRSQGSTAKHEESGGDRATLRP